MSSAIWLYSTVWLTLTMECLCIYGILYCCMLNEKTCAFVQNLMLNASQYEAITRITRAVSQPYASPKICLLQGPPGTGKSYTIIRLIESILGQVQQYSLLSNEFSLVICFTRSAVATNASSVAQSLKLSNVEPG